MELLGVILDEPAALHSPNGQVVASNSANTKAGEGSSEENGRKIACRHSTRRQKEATKDVHGRSSADAAQNRARSGTHHKQLQPNACKRR
jgi:hypothetical protein